MRGSFVSETDRPSADVGEKVVSYTVDGLLPYSLVDLFLTLFWFGVDEHDGGFRVTCTRLRAGGSTGVLRSE